MGEGASPCRFNVLLTTYELVMKDKMRLKKFKYRYPTPTPHPHPHPNPTPIPTPPAILSLTLAPTLTRYIIIDEGHRMKNAASKLSATLLQYESQVRGRGQGKG